MNWNFLILKLKFQNLGYNDYRVLKVEASEYGGSSGTFDNEIIPEIHPTHKFYSNKLIEDPENNIFDVKYLSGSSIIEEFSAEDFSDSDRNELASVYDQDRTKSNTNNRQDYQLSVFKGKYKYLNIFLYFLNIICQFYVNWRPNIHDLIYYFII